MSSSHLFPALADSASSIIVSRGHSRKHTTVTFFNQFLKETLIYRRLHARDPICIARKWNRSAYIRRSARSFQLSRSPVAPQKLITSLNESAQSQRHALAAWSRIISSPVSWTILDPSSLRTSFFFAFDFAFLRARNIKQRAPLYSGSLSSVRAAYPSGFLYNSCSRRCLWPARSMI